MNAKRIAVTAAVLALLTATAQAAKVDVNALVKLQPGKVYKAVLIDLLDPSKLSESEWQITSSWPAGQPSRVRYDLDEIITTPEGGEFVFHTGELTFAQTSTGITCYEVRWGGTPEDMVDFAVVSAAGVTVPRYRVVDAYTHVSAQLTNAAGVPWSDGGCDVSLLALDNGLLQGKLISWEFDQGASCSLWAKPGGGLCGIECGWYFLLITETVR